jgi:hypothetical protein
MAAKADLLAAVSGLSWKSSCKAVRNPALSSAMELNLRTVR